MALGNIKDYVSRPMDKPYLEDKCIKSRSVAVPSTIFQGDAIEPKTGIKFPAFLEDDSSPSTTVIYLILLGYFTLFFQGLPFGTLFLFVMS